MRTLTVNLYPNDGIGTLYTAQGLTGKLASAGTLSWTIDEQLTKFTPGSLSLKVWDDDGTVWSWVQTQLATTLGATSQLFPPWLTLDVNGARAFLGVVDPVSLERDVKTGVVSMQAQDWSIMLANQPLDNWRRPVPKGYVPKVQAGPWNGTFSGPMGAMSGTLTFAGDLTGAIQVNDLLRQDYSGQSFKVTSVTLKGSNTVVVLYGISGNGTWSWTRLGAPVSDQPAYRVATAVTGTTDAPIYEIPVDTVDYLVPGDVLERPGKGQVHVDDVDPERKTIISATPITESFLANDILSMSADSALEIVQQDAISIMRAAVAPFTLDVSAWAPPAISAPVFAWLPWFNISQGDNLRGISDAEPTLTGLRLMGGGNSWAGSPEQGYTVSAGTSTRYVIWTAQRTTAPSFLMPDETPALAPRARDRNRGYFAWKNNAPKILNASWDPVDPDDSPVANDLPPVTLAHDYAAMRRWKLSSALWTEERWNGAVWTSAAAVTPSSASGGPWTPTSACPYVLTSATTGPTPLGKALLVLAYAGGTTQLQLHFAGASAAVCNVSQAIGAGAKLVTTPYGAYLVGPGGYGRVNYSAGVLSLAWAPVVDASTCWLQPNTLSAIDPNSVWVLGRLDWYDALANTRGSETRLFQLSADPTVLPVIRNGQASMGVKVAGLPPRICTMFRDAYDPARLVGIFGSRIFQVAAKLPATVERIKAQGLTASELVEHVSQAINAIVYPLPTGALKVIPRGLVGGVTALTVDQVEVKQSRVSEHFFSFVRVTGVDDSIYADAPGAWSGGKTLELNSHPMIHGEAAAYALATAYASFLGRPRRKEAQTWFFSDADSAPPWEALAPWGQLTVNGGGTTWILAGMSADLVKGEAKTILLEA